MIAGNKRDISISMLRANLIPLLIGIPIAIAQLSLFVVLRGAIQVRFELPGALLFFAVLLVSVVVHEIIHGLTWRVAAKASSATITYGVHWKTMTPYAHVRGLMEVNASELSLENLCTPQAGKENRLAVSVFSVATPKTETLTERTMPAAW